jgi:hypothetical protein
MVREALPVEKWWGGAAAYVADATSVSGAA